MKIEKNKTVCIIGLGFVGLTLSIVMANRGFRVYGVEKNKFILNSLKKKRGHFYEPGLEKNLKKIISNGKFSFFKKIPKKEKIKTYIVTVGTPLDKRKKTINNYIIKTCNEIAKVLKSDDIVILRSTVKVGTSRNVVYRILKKTGKKFYLAYCPERAVEGSALKELYFLPQIIGGIDNSSIKIASGIFKKITKKIVKTSNIETAEIIKLIDNSSRDVFFAYANEIARMCDSVGLDASEVINSGKSGYHRTDIAKPGLVGGPCLYKDPYIFSESFKKYGVSAEITLTARKINERQPKEIVNFIYKHQKKVVFFPKNPKISLIGLAFKGYPVTDDLRGSMAIEVFKALKKKFKLSKFFGYDPLVPGTKIKKIGLQKSHSILDSFKNKNLVVILNNHHIFSKMPIEKLARQLKKPALIYDFWNHFEADNIKLPNKVEYICLGSHYKKKNFNKK